MGYHRILAPHTGTLGHSEAMLFVNDREREILELHLVFDKSVGAYGHLNLPGSYPLQREATCLGTGAAGKQGHFYAQRVGPCGNSLEMLSGENLGGSHYGSLTTVVTGHQHRHESHHRLSTPYVALKKAIHLASGTHIIAYLMKYPFLCTRELKR